MHAWNLFDWAGMDTPAKGIVTHINCQAVHGLRQAAQLAESLKRWDLARRWTKVADEIAAAVNKHLWSPRRNAYLTPHEGARPGPIPGRAPFHP